MTGLPVKYYILQLIIHWVSAWIDFEPCLDFRKVQDRPHNYVHKHVPGFDRVYITKFIQCKDLLKGRIRWKYNRERIPQSISIMDFCT